MFQKNILVKETHFPFILIEQKHGEPAKGCFGSSTFFRVLWDLNTRISQRLMEGDNQLEWVKGRGFWKIFQKSTSWGWEKSRRLSETKCCRFDVQVEHNILRPIFVNIWISYEKSKSLFEETKIYTCILIQFKIAWNTDYLRTDYLRKDYSRICFCAGICLYVCLSCQVDYFVTHITLILWLREKCSDKEFFWVRIFLYPDWICE